MTRTAVKSDHGLRVSALFPILAERRNQAGGTLEWRRTADAGDFARLDGPAAAACCWMSHPWGWRRSVVKQIFEIIKKINKENNTTIFPGGAKCQPRL
jgi:branched-chain amino acid transport system ATP-binding protein